ncbi:hypothetical protein F5148DRAFT_599528 [Russula earlei]|uniref:Uncharacterized protein n=1 Tax=Russula earlei TaxID=71964 RepID=A0ACC0UHM3_9AGAM|nr:hypothetical protein F5148DRAFT_599528 [Russula earlei]
MSQSGRGYRAHHPSSPTPLPCLTAYLPSFVFHLSHLSEIAGEEHLVLSHSTRGTLLGTRLRATLTPITRSTSIYPRPSAPNRAPKHSKPHRTFIHVLDDDSLLNIFYLYRPDLMEEAETYPTSRLQGGEWDRERWWYKFAHVCRRWRYLLLASAPYLGLCLVCTRSTPVADMLAHSPPLPLIVDLLDQHHDITARDEGRITLALQQRHRVRRVRLAVPLPKLQNFMMAMDGDFPILDYLYIRPPTKPNAHLTLPDTLRAPRLRRLVLFNVFCPIGSPLLTTATGVVALSLQNIPPSAYFSPNDLLQLLSLVRRLETLRITFPPPPPNRDVERELLNTPIKTRVALPDLRWFEFGGESAYLEALLPRMTTPLLEKLHIMLLNPFTSPLPCLLPFMTAARNLRFSGAGLRFYGGGVGAMLYRDEPRIHAFIYVTCRGLDWQVSSVARIFNILSPISSGVVNLSLDYRERSSPPGVHSEADRSQWRGLLRSFNNVKALRVHGSLVGELSRCLQWTDGESHMELLPGLTELSYYRSGDAGLGTDAGDTFSRFVKARQIAGRPVSLVRG